MSLISGNVRKAFDSVNHQILLKRLPGYGIKNHELRWFENYLTSRCQSVVYGISARQQIKFGVPQGPIHGPILFSIYINDLPNCLLQSKILLYADDAVLFCADSNIGKISKQNNTKEEKSDKKVSSKVAWTEYLTRLKDHKVLRNYRPISNLKVISKIIQKVVAVRLQNYLESNQFNEPLL